jgi:glycosyltransferase involved in cell wall biosynthesis
MSDHGDAREATVLIVGPVLPTGGVTRYLKQLLGWSGHYSYRCFDCARPPKTALTRDVGYAVILSAGWARAVLGACITLKNLALFPHAVRKSECSLVHVCGINHWVFWENAFYVLAARALGRKVTMHYLDSLDLYWQGSGTIERAAIRWVLSRLDALFVLSAVAASTAAEIGLSSVTTVVPSSVQVDAFQSAAHETSDGSLTNALFVGGLDPMRKGLLDVLAAGRVLADEAVPLRIVITGQAGPVDVERLAPGSTARMDLDFKGYPSDAEMIALYASSDMLILPSRDEGLPYVIIEALASGLPVVASDVGGISDAVRDGVSGILIEPGAADQLADAMRRLSLDAQYRRELGEHARQIAVEEFSTDICLARVERVFDAVLHGS